MKIKQECQGIDINNKKGGTYTYNEKCKSRNTRFNKLLELIR